MKIKTRFLLGLSSKPILLLLLLGIGLYQISSLNKLNITTQHNVELSLLAEDIQREIKDEAISLRNIVIFQDGESVQKEINHLQMKSNSVYENISILDSKVDTIEQKKMVEDLKTTNRNFNLYVEEVKKLVSESDRDSAIDLINNNGHTIHGEFLNVITVISKHFQTNLKSSFDGTTQDFQRNIMVTTIISLISVLLSAAIVVHTVWTFANRLRTVSGIMNNVANGTADLSTRIKITSNDEIDDVAHSFNLMSQSLVEQRLREQNISWIHSNIAEIMTSLSGIHNLESLSRTLLSKVVPLMESSHAVIYVKDIKDSSKESVLKRAASYAFSERKNEPYTIALGEGLIGQAALENLPILLTEIPSDYIRIQSGLGEAAPLNVYIIPISFEGNVNAVLELASFKPFSSTQQSFIEELVSGVGVILDSVIGRIKLANLLEETQVLMEEIQAQSEELQSQQEELRVTNEELEAQTHDLRRSEEKLQVQQEELEQSHLELKEKAKSLEEQNKRFEEANREVEDARAKLEEKARQLTLSSKYKSEFLANMSHELRTPLNSLLILSKLLADNKEGNLSGKQVEYSRTIYSSGKDLLSLINDILDLEKFESGKTEIYPTLVEINELISVMEDRFKPVAAEKNLSFTITLKDDGSTTIYSDEKRILQVLENLLSNAFKFTHHGGVTLEIETVHSQGHFGEISFSIKDTGIGIPKEKQELIFQAFQQADGTTSRKYGGTGLGLSICREISILLGGRVTVASEEGKGSTFTFIVGDYIEEEGVPESPLHLDEVAAEVEIMVEDEHPSTTISHTALEEKDITCQSENIKRLLIVDDDLKQRNSLMELVGEMDIIIKAVATGKEAIEELKVSQFDIIILDLGLSDTTGFDVLKKVKGDSVNDHLTVLVYTGRDLTSKEELELKKYTQAIIVKNEHSIERLKRELELCLNGSTGKAEGNTQVGVTQGLEGKKVLLVDDDVRNVYALSSFLELYGMNITFAENGLECLDIFEKTSNFDLILMDIMMPEMDGYETIRRLRTKPDFNIPIIALTAKAMKEDREKCMEVGASDYIVKPFNPDQLLSLIRVWVYSQEGVLK
jgi:signal transduction histidine kinase/DNA-binding response OmpR family regulator/CHASE3 domain sensor protein